MRRVIALLALGAAALASTAAAAPASSQLVFIANSRGLHPSVAIANANGSGVRTLGPGGNARISPDGTQVAAVETLGQNQATSELLDYPTGAGAVRHIAHFDGFISMFGWSADSKLLLVYGPTGSSGAGPLQVVNMQTGAITKIAKGAVSGASFEPSAADQIVYGLASSLLSTAPTKLYVTSASGNGRRAIASNATTPVWGAEFIAFSRCRSRGSEYAPICQLWSISPNGTGARQLTHIKVDNLASGLVPIAFSANGKHLLASFQGTDQSATWTVDLSGPTAAARQLDGEETLPNAISSNGQEVLLSSGFEGTQPSLLELPWAGGKPTVLAPHGFAGSWNL